MFLKHCVDGAPQVADSFPVNDPDLEHIASLALGQIIENKILHLARLERVQVEHAIDRKLNGLIHGLNLPSVSRMKRSL